MELRRLCIAVATFGATLCCSGESGEGQSVSKASLARELLDALETEKLLSPIEPGKSDEFQRQLIAVLNADAKVIDRSAIPSAATAYVAEGTRAAVLNVSSIDASPFAAIAEIKEFISGKGINSIIVDLTNAAGRSNAYYDGISDFLKAVNIPYAVLINEKTTGTAEEFAFLMKQSGVKIFGTQSSGHPGAGKCIKLPSGSELLVPAPYAPPIQPDVVLDFAQRTHWHKVIADTLVVIHHTTPKIQKVQ